MAVDRIVQWYEIVIYLFQTTLTFKVYLLLDFDTFHPQ